jgi:hypothetical protein
MRTVWREIVVELARQEEPVWEQAVSRLWLDTEISREYYECPISYSEKGKARLPFDADIILGMIDQLNRLDNADKGICSEISRKLAQSYAREKMS